MTLVNVVFPRPATVNELPPFAMLPLSVKVWPLAMVQVWGELTVMGVLIVAEALAVMPLAPSVRPYEEPGAIV